MTPSQKKGDECEKEVRDELEKCGLKVEKIHVGADFKVTAPNGKTTIVEVKFGKGKPTPMQKLTQQILDNVGVENMVIHCPDKTEQNQPQNQQSDPCNCR